MYFVYVLYSKSHGCSYVGLTMDLDGRLKSHNAGEVRSTKAFVPWERVHHEGFADRLGARKREKYLKSAAGRRWRKNNLGD
ncbi:MAG: GIY-YIG nuclease family protein [Marinirhabdus sp.]